MDPILEKIQQIRLVPVVAIDNADDTEGLCSALVAGDIPCAEITFRTAAAPEAIRIAAKNPDMLVGAGTVLSIDQAKQAVDCGAKFIVSPGFSPKVVQWCLDNNVPVTPGTCTPTDIQMAVDFGLEVVKFFPAESYGGLSTLKALAAPYTKMKFMPTGGITTKNVTEYLAFNKVIACGGSWMVKGELITGKKFDEITAISKEAAALAKSV